MAIKIITTEDGSHSLFDEQLNETYHSTRGAIGESTHVFIEHGIRFFEDPKELHILEVGFGTGLNAWLTALFAEKVKMSIDYVTLEPFPITEDIISQLNYSIEDEGGLFQQLHAIEWGHTVAVTAHFSIRKLREKLEGFESSKQFDLIYYDAFAPSKQPELWTEEPLRKCFNLLRNGGALTTYCAQGQFKRNLKAIGFEVETLPGAMGKKEMVRGVKA